MFGSGVAGVRLGSGCKVTWDSGKNIKVRTIIKEAPYKPDSTTKELMSLMNPSCSIAFRVRDFLVSTRVAVSS